MPILLAGAVVRLGTAGRADAEDTKYAAEAKWARRIVDDYFWHTWDSLTGSSSTPLALLSPELAKAEQEDGNGSFTFRIFTRYAAPEVTGTEVAPDGSEVIVRGTLKGQKSILDEQRADAVFTMRVAREGGGGKWSIRTITLRDREPAGGKGK